MSRWSRSEPQQQATPHEMAGGGAVQPYPSAHRVGRRGWFSIGGVFIALLLVGVLSIVRVPYVILSPGPISDTLGETSDGKELITVSGAPIYPTEGSLDFTTVRVLGGPGYRVNVWDVLRAGIDPDSVVFPEEVYFPPNVTAEQVQEENVAEMTGSQQDAIAVALRGIGADVTQTVSIRGIGEDAPAKDALETGDVIVSVDGQPASDTAAVQAAVRAHAGGEDVTIDLTRDGKAMQVKARTTETDGRTVLGIVLGAAYDFPFTVNVDAGEVGGPSAGLMFSLGIYDTLTPGGLTGGQNIAGTGTIDAQGNVGPIGGIRQKLIGARQGGATWFLAPADNCDEVVDHVPDGLQVFKVGTFGEGRTAVEAIADGDTSDLPTCTG